MYQVRNGQRVVPTCPTCGCRLHKAFDGLYTHFYTPNPDGSISQDAQGHQCINLHIGWLPSKQTQYGTISLATSFIQRY